NDAIQRLTVGALGGSEDALLSKDLSCPLHVPVGLFERPLGVHYPGPGRLPQLFDLCSCDCHETSLLLRRYIGSDRRLCTRGNDRYRLLTRIGGGVFRRRRIRAGLDARFRIRRPRELVAMCTHSRAGFACSAAFDRRVSHLAEDQLDRSDSVVVARDRVRHRVGVTIRIDERHDRDVQAYTLRDRDVLFHRVDDEDGRGQALHRLDAAKIAVHPLDFVADIELFFLRQTRVVPPLHRSLKVLQVLHAALDRPKVRERAAKPTVVDERQRCARRFHLDRFPGLLLRADNEHVGPPRDNIADEVDGRVEPRHRLLQVDDVNAVSFGEDELAHFRVPAPRLVAEVNPGLQELLHTYGLYQSRFSKSATHRFARERARAAYAQMYHSRIATSDPSRKRISPDADAAVYRPRFYAPHPAPAYPSFASSSRATSRSSHGCDPSPNTIDFSWPLPHTTTMSPGSACANACAIASRRSSISTKSRPRVRPAPSACVPI